jgi:hypothetical protein
LEHSGNPRLITEQAYPGRAYLGILIQL